MQLVFTNTLTHRREPFFPQHMPMVTMYVCGITPYDFAHMGHGRVYVTFDVVYRLLTYLGYQVTYCRNFTDIDDKLLVRAQEEFGDAGRYHEIASRYIATYHHDMKALNCLPPTYEPRVTEHMPQIIDFVTGLIDAGAAYEADGDVYFDISAYKEYGKLSRRNVNDLMVGARVAPNEKKRNPLDFALWKSAARDEVGWDSPWGYGRPGWHIECSALAWHYLGKTIDIHAGGMDLIFPHHENEVAQSEALSHTTFARYWLHNAFVQIDKEKMSKSLGNFFSLRELFEKFDPMVLRYVFLQHQYRNPLDFSLEEIEAAQKSYQRLCKVFVDVPDFAQGAAPQLMNLSPIAQEMMEFLLDDLNTPGLFGVVFQHISAIQEDASLRAEVKFVLKNILGLRLIPLAEKKVEITPEIQALIDEREVARTHKDWAKADALRTQLAALGVDVADKKL